MRDLKEEYYFKTVPQYEANNPHINWDVYNCILNVVLTYSALDARVAKMLTQWDLFPSAFNLLAILVRTDGEGMHLSRISELLAVSRANVTGLVDVLARKGLVTRESSSSDRRVRLAKLTDKGQTLIGEILPHYYDFNASLCNEMSKELIQATNDGLLALRKAACIDDEELEIGVSSEEESIRA